MRSRGTHVLTVPVPQAAAARPVRSQEAGTAPGGQAAFPAASPGAYRAAYPAAYPACPGAYPDRTLGGHLTRVTSRHRLARRFTSHASCHTTHHVESESITPRCHNTEVTSQHISRHDKSQTPTQRTDTSTQYIKTTEETSERVKG